MLVEQKVCLVAMRLTHLGHDEEDIIWWCTKRNKKIKSCGKDEQEQRSNKG